MLKRDSFPHLPTITLAALTMWLGTACGSDPATRISAGPETLSFDGSSVAQIEIAADGSWVAHTSEPWLSIEPESASGDETVTVTVDRSALSVGTYSGSIAIAGDAETSVSVPVLMRFPSVSGHVQDPGNHLTFERRDPPALRPGADYAPGEVVVRLREPMIALEAHGRHDAPVGTQELQLATERLGAAVHAVRSEVVSSAFGIAKIEVAADDVSEVVAALEADGRTVYAEPNLYMRPTAADDAFYHVQWHYENIHLEEAWTYNDGYPEVVVAVVDGDFHPNHPDLRDNLLPGWNFHPNSAELEILNEDCGAHGTHVAGTIAAVTNNGEGVAGVAPNVKILPLNVAIAPTEENPTPDCDLSILGMGLAILYAAGLEDDEAGQLDKPVDVINISLGGDRSEFVADTLAFARDQGVISIAAAGNSNGGAVGAPASLSTTVAVSATDQFFDIANYSSIGPEVWIAAPGGALYQDFESYEGEGEPPLAGVLSTGFTYDSLPDAMVYGERPQEAGHGYLLYQGTSMASPHVAGVAALMRSANPRLGPGQVADILAQTAIRRGDDGRTIEYGFGHLDAAAAVGAASDALEVPRQDVVVRLVQGSNVVAESSVDTGGAFALGEVEAGQYTLRAGDTRDGQQGVPGTVFGELSVSIDYDGDVSIDVPLSAR